MEYKVVGRGIEVTPAMKEQAIKKLSRIEKYFDSSYPVKCVITYSVGQVDQTVEINVHSKNTDLRAKVISADTYSAVDLALDKLEKQLRRIKTKKAKFKKRNSLAEDMRLDLLEANSQDNLPIEKIVKRKNLNLTPMDVEEALCRMEALDHNFFIYLDSASQKTCVIYKRNEGDFGLIEIE
jgi:putative sigma-54 modulation protein